MSKRFLSGINVTGSAALNTVADAGSNTDKFLVLDSSNVVSYRTASELYADLGIGSLPAGYTSTLKHEVKASQSISKGQAVYVSSSDGTNMIISKASNVSEGTSSKTMGLLETSLSTNGKGNVITEGLLAGLNTNGATPGDPVWLGVDGALIFGLANKPYAPAHLVFIGIVTRANANNGEIFVKVQNGFEMNELHNYQQGSVQNNEVIVYESSTSLYKPKSIPTILGYTPVPDSRTLTINGTAYDLSADRSWTISANQNARTEYEFTTNGSTATYSATYTVGQVDVFYNGSKLSSAEFTATNGTSVTLAFTPPTGQLVEVVAWETGGGVSNGRTLTINGTSYDLSADRSWTVTDSSKLPLIGGTLTGALNGTSALFTGNLRTDTGLGLKYGSFVSTSGYLNLFSALVGSTFTFNLKEGTGGYESALTFTNTANRNYIFPNADGTIALTSNLSSYLPLTGGNITGNLTIGSPSSALAQFHIYNASAAASMLVQTNSAGDYAEIAARNFNQTSTCYYRQYSSSAAGTLFGASASNLASLFSNFASNFAIGTLNGGDLILGTANTQRLRITASTGAATFSSSVTAGVLNTSNAFSDTINISQTSGSTIKGHLGVFADSLYISNNYFYNGAQSYDDTSKANSSIEMGTGFIYLKTGAANTTPGTRMTVTSSGNVGIGTSIPESLANNTTLQIDGTSHSFVRTGTSNYGGYFFTIPTADAMGLSSVRNPVTGTFSNTGKAGSAIVLFGESGNGYMTFSTINANNAAPAERMRITSGGNVLIGATNDTYRLAVVNNGASAFIGLSNQSGTTGDRFLRMGFGTGISYATIQGTRLNVADDVNIVMQGGGGNVLIGTTSNSLLGSNTKLRVTGNGGSAALGSVYFGGTSAVSTGISINQYDAGAAVLFICSRHDSDGTATQAAVYLIRFYYDGNNAPTTHYLGGSSNWAEFGVSAGNLTVRNPAGGAASFSWFGNK